MDDLLEQIASDTLQATTPEQFGALAILQVQIQIQEAQEKKK